MVIAAVKFQIAIHSLELQFITSELATLNHKLSALFVQERAIRTKGKRTQKFAARKWLLLPI